MYLLVQNSDGGPIDTNIMTYFTLKLQYRIRWLLARFVRNIINGENVIDERELGTANGLQARKQCKQ